MVIFPLCETSQLVLSIALTVRHYYFHFIVGKQLRLIKLDKLSEVTWLVCAMKGIHAVGFQSSSMLLATAACCLPWTRDVLERISRHLDLPGSWLPEGSTQGGAEHGSSVSLCRDLVPECLLCCCFFNWWRPPDTSFPSVKTKMLATPEIQFHNPGVYHSFSLEL